METIDTNVTKDPWVTKNIRILILYTVCMFMFKVNPKGISSKPMSPNGPDVQCLISWCQ